MTSKQTTDYSLFKILPFNRPLIPKYIQKLVTSIQEKNTLSYNPLLVNKKMEVIDGQRRLKAAEILSLPIFYLVLDEAGLREIILRNANIRTGY